MDVREAVVEGEDDGAGRGRAASQPVERLVERDHAVGGGRQQVELGGEAVDGHVEFVSGSAADAVVDQHGGAGAGPASGAACEAAFERVSYPVSAELGHAVVLPEDVGAVVRPCARIRRGPGVRRSCGTGAGSVGLFRAGGTGYHRPDFRPAGFAGVCGTACVSGVPRVRERGARAQRPALRRLPAARRYCP